MKEITGKLEVFCRTRGSKIKCSNKPCHSFSDEQRLNLLKDLKPSAEHEILSTRTPNTTVIVFQTSTRKIQSNLKPSAERETNIKESKVYCNSFSKAPRRNILNDLNLFTQWELEQNQVLKTSFTFFPQIEGNYQKKHGFLCRTSEININDSKHQYHSFPEVRKKRLKLSWGRNSKKKDDHQLLKRPRSVVSRKAEK